MRIRVSQCKIIVLAKHCFFVLICCFFLWNVDICTLSKWHLDAMNSSNKYVWIGFWRVASLYGCAIVSTCISWSEEWVDPTAVPTGLPSFAPTQIPVNNPTLVLL
jgi:hypothetical protein